MDEIHFTRSMQMPVSAKVLADWHGKPGAFGRVQPPWEKASIVKKAAAIANDLEEHIRINIGPFKKMWIARYHDVIDGEQFCDLQVSGPFAYWDHKHIFKAIDEGKSELVDEVSYKEPLGPPGRFLAGKMIYNKLDRMFRYRHAITSQDLERYHKRKIPSKKILVAGGTGFIGSALVPLLQTLGHEVKVLTRKPTCASHVAWDPALTKIDLNSLEWADVVINLAGYNIATPWTKKAKKKITDSRLQSSQTLVDAMLSLKEAPKVFISASGSSIYPLYDGREYDESGPAGEGFLPDLARRWEAVSEPLVKVGIRTLKLRIGLVLSPAGGALQKMLPAFSLGLGGPFGTGSQHMSWITLDDLLDVIVSGIENEALEGAVNAVSPQPITNKEFCQTLAKVLKRPCFLKVPEFLLRRIPGGMGQELFLASNRVIPAKLLALGHKYRYTDLEQALRYLMGLA